jgi:hypothetical protein
VRMLQQVQSDGADRQLGGHHGGVVIRFVYSIILWVAMAIRGLCVAARSDCLTSEATVIMMHNPT